MEERICPKCKKSIRSQDALFCYHCGSQIVGKTQEVSSQSEDLLAPSAKQNGTPNNKKLNKVFPALLVLFILISVPAGFFIYKKYFGGSNVVEKLESPLDVEREQSFEIDLSDVEIALIPGEFGSKNLSKMAPVGIDAFIVLNGSGDFFTNYVEERVDFDVEELTGLTVEEASSFLENSFALIFRENSFAFLAKAKNNEFVSEKIEQIDLENIHMSLVGGYLVIANDINLLNEMENINNELSLSLASDAFYVESTKNLPSEGLALVFFRDSEKVKKIIGRIVDLEALNFRQRNAFVARQSGIGALLEFK